MRIVHKPTNLTHSYRMFAPSGKFKSFRIKERSAIGKMVGVTKAHPNYKTSPDFRSIVESLDSLNAALHREEMTVEAARVQVQLLIEQLYRLEGVKFRQANSHGDNQKLLEDYLERVIKRRKTKNSSKIAARQYMQRAINALGNVSVRTAHIDELQDALDKAYPNGDHRQRQLAVNLNSLLRFAGRHDVKIQRNRSRPPKVKYLSNEQFAQMVAVLETIKASTYSVEAFTVLAKLAFYTGLRIGELMALEMKDFDPKSLTLKVLTQIDKDNEFDVPKWGKVRTVAVFSEVKDLYPLWIELKAEIPHEVRLRAARIVKDACMRTFPKRKDLWITFHDLRHCFAIKNLQQGLSLELIARQLGNSVRVCETYYLGFVHTNVTLEQTAFLLNRKSG